MTTQLRDTTLELTDRLKAMGVPLPMALKRRDPKEPGRRKKEATEAAIEKLFGQYFRKQGRAIREIMMRISPERKTLFGYDEDYYLSHFGDEFWDDPEMVAKLGRILTAATASGLDIFAEMISLEIDYTLVNEGAARWATKYAGEMVTKIDETTLKTLRTAMSDFVSTPGMTIGDIMNRLPYKESRSRLIAIDQTTTVYANAEKLAGEALQKEYPDVLVIKTWYSNRDDRVCPICQPMHMQERKLDEPFTGGDGMPYDKPGSHIGCRCWHSITTRLGDIE